MGWRGMELFLIREVFAVVVLGLVGLEDHFGFTM